MFLNGVTVVDVELELGVERAGVDDDEVVIIVVVVLGVIVVVVVLADDDSVVDEVAV